MNVAKPNKAESKVYQLVGDMPEFDPIQSHRGNYVYEVDGYRISIGPNYKNETVQFRIYKLTDDNLELVKVGNTEEVIQHLPERFAQAILFQLDLLQ